MLRFVDQGASVDVPQGFVAPTFINMTDQDVTKVACGFYFDFVRQGVGRAKLLALSARD